MITISPNELTIEGMMMLTKYGIFAEINNGEVKLVMEV